MDLAVISDLNWLGVIVAAVVYFAIGGLWYSPVLFANQWIRSMGWEPPEDMKPNPLTMLAPLGTCFAEAVAIGLLAEATATNTFAEGLSLAVVVALLVLSLFVVTAAFEPVKPQPWVWAAITGGYHVLGVAASAVIIATL